MCVQEAQPREREPGRPLGRALPGHMLLQRGVFDAITRGFLMSINTLCGVSRSRIFALVPVALTALALAGPAMAQVQIDADPPDSVGEPLGAPSDSWAFSLGLGRRGGA